MKTNVQSQSAVEYWCRKFESFFEKRANSILQIFEAKGCREGWLQGEMFLHFAGRWPSVWCNHHPLEEGGKVDLAAYSSAIDDVNKKPSLVGELKMLRLDYQGKNITGRHKDAHILRETLERSGRQSLIVKDDPETRLAKDRGHNSLFRDYLRLIDAGFEYPVLRVLILVLDLRNAKEENDAGFLLKRIEFERKGEDLFKSESLWVRAWFLHGRKHVRKAA